MADVAFPVLPDDVWCGSDVLAEGNWYVLPVELVRYIYPKNPRTGKSMRVTLITRYMHLRHSVTDMTFSFKCYKHQGRWLWADSRDQRPDVPNHRKRCDRSDVIVEVARCVTRGDHAAATTMVDAHLGGCD